MRDTLNLRNLSIVLVMSFILVAIPAGQAPAHQTGKLSSRLAALSAVGPQTKSMTLRSQGLGLPSSGPGSLTFDPRGRILVYVRLNAAGPALLSPLTRAGAEVVNLSSRYGMATVWISTADLQSLAGAANVMSVREVLKPMIRSRNSGRISPQGLWWCTGSVTAESDELIKAKDARSIFDVHGEGVRVGVLSDSFGVRTDEPTMATDILTGDLPGEGNPCGWTQPIVIRREGLSDGDDEGRAMAQIIHDSAPAADIRFASAWYGLFDFADQIRALREVNHCEVIVDDISYFTSPFFQDGPLAVAVDEVTADGAFYYSSAGNANDTDEQGHGLGAYEAPRFRPMTFNFSYEGTSYDTVHDFDPASGTDPTMNYILRPGAQMYVLLQWSEPWYGVVTDLDLFLLDENNQVLTASAEANTGSIGMPWPYEGIYYYNDTGADQNVAVVIARASGSGAPAVKFITPYAYPVARVEYHSGNSTDTFGASIWGQPAASSAVAVGAVPYNDVNTPEYYTSLGNPSYQYGPVTGQTPAALLSAPDTRIKPEIAAPDGLANTFFYYQYDGVYRFYGTSCAAPVAAAVGALMKSRAGQLGVTLSAAQAKTYMQLTASTIANGTTRAIGSGMVSALGAVNAVQDTAGPTTWVERMYSQVLDRSATTAESDNWVAQLAAATAWGETVARSLLLGDEFIARNLSDESFVYTLWRALIGYDPETTAQVTYYTDQLAAGRSRADLIDEFLAASEFDELCASYNVDPYQD